MELKKKKKKKDGTTKNLRHVHNSVEEILVQLAN